MEKKALQCFYGPCLKAQPMPRLLTSQPDGAWTAGGFSPFPGSGRRETWAACRSPAGCAGEREGQQCSQGQDGTGRCRPPRAPLADPPARSRQGLPWAAAHPDRLLARLNSEPGEKVWSYAGAREKWKQRYRTSGLFPLAPAAGHGISAAPSSRKVPAWQIFTEASAAVDRTAPKRMKNKPTKWYFPFFGTQ